MSVNKRLNIPLWVAQAMVAKVDKIKKGANIAVSECGKGILISALLNKLKEIELIENVRTIHLYDDNVKMLDASELAIKKIAKHIKILKYTESFLDTELMFDVIVAQPPLIPYKDQDTEYRLKLLNDFKLKYKPKLYTYYMDKNLSALKENGISISLVPNSFNKNLSSKITFKKMQKHKVIINDFKASEIFKGIPTQFAGYILIKNNESELNFNKWTGSLFMKDRMKELDKKLELYKNSDFKVVTGVKTNLDSVFLSEEENDVFTIPAISGWKKEKPQWTIALYKNTGTSIEWGYLSQYVQKYLRKNRLVLEERNYHDYWFNYGRRQAVNTIWKDKLIVPLSTIDFESKVVRSPSIGYACIIITSKSDSLPNLMKLSELFNSSAFRSHVASTNKKILKSGYYEITANICKTFLVKIIGKKL